VYDGKNADDVTYSADFRKPAAPVRFTAAGTV